MQKTSHIVREDSQEHLPNIHKPTVNMKRRTLAGTCGVGIFIVAFAAIVIAFATPNWLVSDYRITGAKLDRLGLWVHCFRSLRDVNDNKDYRFFVGCRWVYDPFTTGYDQIRGFLLPAFMITTQFFFTLAFIGMLVSAVGVLVFFLCAGPDQKHFILLIRILGYVLLATAVSSSIAVIVFAIFGNRNGWMPEHANNWFGWSFVVACVGAVMSYVAAILFLTEANIQHKKRKQFKESQTRFELVRGESG